MFKLEALFAREGDCLLLHYGPSEDEAKWILIDGGASGTWRRFLRPRLQEMKDASDAADPRVPLQMVMVSHVDADHITGVLKLFEHLRDEPVDDQVCVVGQLWHNAFDDTIGQEDKELVSALVAPVAGAQAASHEATAVVQSVKQGRDLRNAAAAVGTRTNKEFEGLQPDRPGLVRLQPGPAQAIDMGSGLTFKVVGPSEARLREYQEEWNDFLEDKGIAEAQAASFDDESAYNLASLVVLAERDGKTMLLTGDARGDFLVNGMVEAGLLGPEAAYPERKPGQRKKNWKEGIEAAEARTDFEPFPVDVFKLPHHGSDRNITVGVLKRIPAKHYVISADGKHHNPDRPTLDMIKEARGDAEYTIHFTFTADQHEREDNQTRKEALEAVHDWVTNDKPANCTVLHRQDGDHSISVDL